MKTLMKKMKRVFSANTGNKGINASGSRTTRSGHSQSSHNRMLPFAPGRSARNGIQSITYEKAEEFINKNKLVVEQTLEIIEMYPELLKHSTSNKLVDFISKCCVQINNSHSKYQTNGTKDWCVDAVHESENMDQKLTKKQIKVPEILVSHAHEDDVLCESHSPTVFVCGNLNDNNWHRLLIDLSRVHNVHCFSAQHSFYNECKTSDILVFLMDEISVYDKRYTDHLQSAVTNGVEVVYVRDMSFELQESREFNDKKRSKPFNKLQRKMQLYSSNNSLYSLKSFKSLSRDSSFDNVSLESDDSCISDSHALKKRYMNTEQMCTLSTSHSAKRPSTPKQSIDTAKMLRSEYGTAHCYHQIYHDRCMERILSAVDSKMHLLSRATSCSGFSSASLTPSAQRSIYSSVSNDSAIDDMYKCLSPDLFLTRKYTTSDDMKNESEDQYLPNDSDSTAKETLFLVSNKASKDNSVKFRSWPDDGENDSMNSSPSIDSFGFQDIDLSKQINNLDLFGSGYSD